MNTANEIIKNASAVAAAMSAAEAVAISVDQDWDNETTTYMFEDGSSLEVSGNSMKAKSE